MTTNMTDVLRSAQAIGSGSLVSAKAYAQMLDPLTSASAIGRSGAAVTTVKAAEVANNQEVSPISAAKRTIR